MIAPSDLPSAALASATMRIFATNEVRSVRYHVTLAPIRTDDLSLRSRARRIRSEGLRPLGSSIRTPSVRPFFRPEAADARHFERRTSCPILMPSICWEFAIFVHGCFWHSHENCALASDPKSNQNYWFPKLQRTKARDLEHIKRLERLGYRVLVIWECASRKPAQAADEIAVFFESQRSRFKRRRLARRQRRAK